MYVDFTHPNEVNCLRYIHVKKDVEVHDYLSGNLRRLTVVLTNKMREMETPMSAVENELKSISSKDVE